MSVRGRQLFFQIQCSRGCSTDTFVIHYSQSLILCGNIFKTPVRARELKFGEKVHTYHVSYVTCQMSHDAFKKI